MPIIVRPLQIRYTYCLFQIQYAFCAVGYTVTYGDLTGYPEKLGNSAFELLTLY